MYGSAKQAIDISSMLLIKMLSAENSSTMKRSEVLVCATTWMDLENTMLSEISQTQNNKYCMVTLI